MDFEEYDDENPQDEANTDEDAIIIEDDEEDLNYRAQDASEVEDTKETEKQHDDGKKKIGNPFAALRIAERNNKILADRLAQIVERLDSRRAEPEIEEEEEIVDDETNPIPALSQKVDKLLKETKKSKEEQEKDRKLSEVREVLSVADDRIAEFRSSIGVEEYNNAVEYVVNLKVQDFEDVYPDKTRDEIENLVARAAMEEKYNLARSGKNPAQVIYEYAKRHGFRPQKAKSSEDGTTQVRKIDPKQTIKRDKERQDKSRTISTTPGKNAKTPSVDDFVGMSEDEFDDYLTQLEKDKGYRRGGGMRVAEILDS